MVVKCGGVRCGGVHVRCGGEVRLSGVVVSGVVVCM